MRVEKARRELTPGFERERHDVAIPESARLVEAA
jgi:hypothetical protein